MPGGTGAPPLLRLPRLARLLDWLRRGFHSLQLVEIIASYNADTQRHFLMARRSIPIAAFSKSTSCVVSDS